MVVEASPIHWMAQVENGVEKGYQNHLECGEINIHEFKSRDEMVIS